MSILNAELMRKTPLLVVVPGITAALVDSVRAEGRVLPGTRSPIHDGSLPHPWPWEPITSTEEGWFLFFLLELKTPVHPVRPELAKGCGPNVVKSPPGLARHG